MDLTPYRYSYRTFSECGPRHKNEDTIGVVEMLEHHDALFILCDGMGGHRYGDVASQTIVSAFDNFWRSNWKRLLCEKKILDAADEAMVALNKRQFLGMGTTMAMVALHKNRLFTAHCGDSRIYYCFNHNGVKITGHLRDHIIITPEGWPYVGKGFIQRETKHIPEVHEFMLRYKPGYRFIICSDGVYNTFDDGEIEDLLKSSLTIDDLTSSLKCRCDAAARDNYSAIVIDIYSE